MRTLMAALLIAIPAGTAFAQNVPALVDSHAGATANENSATASASFSRSGTPNVVQPAALPAGMPPTRPPLSPSAPLNFKERAAAGLAQSWRNHPDKPTRGADGTLLWAYGLSLPSIVCSPLQVCDLALQAGEVVNNINLGDKIRWTVMPSVSGIGQSRVTHLVIKPTDSGLVSSMLIFTNLRTYSIKLISTQTQWTPLTGFIIPEDQATAWERYRDNAAEPVSAAKPSSRGQATEPNSSPVNSADLQFYTISGDNPSWRPLHAYSDGVKTYIQFPHAMRFGSSPALVGLNRDGGWFSDPSHRMVTYRTSGDTYVVDEVLDRAELVEGVDRSQTKVLIEVKN